MYYDEACLILQNVLNDSMSLSRITDECYKCSPQRWADIGPLQTLYLTVPITAVTTFYYTPSTSMETQSCWVTYKFDQHGLYKYVLDLSCDTIEVIEFPSYSHMSLLVFTVIVLVFWIVQVCLSNLNVQKRLQSILKQRLFPEIELENVHSADFSESEIEFTKVTFDEVTQRERVVEYTTKGTNTGRSLDQLNAFHLPEQKPVEFVEFEALLAFRGFVVTMWVYLNVEERTYSFFQSSAWDGLKMDDLLLGWFYWALAASFYLHFHLSLSRGESRKRVFLRGVLLRSAIYCVAGLCYNHINNTSPRIQDFQPQLRTIADFRALGILQRVGLAQLVTSAVEVCVMSRTIKRGPLLRDLEDSWLQWLVCIALASIHVSITYSLPLPNCPTGYSGPGGLYDNFSTPHCTGGAVKYIDHKIFGRRHMPPVELLRQTLMVYQIHEPFEPQGLLGTLTSCLLMALAMQASRVFVYFHHPYSRVIRLTCWGIFQLLVGGVLCGFRQYDGPIPINRYLMSVSYVLVASGLAYLVLLGLYLFISVWNLWSGSPFIYTGANILVMFVGSKLFLHTFPFAWEIPQENMDTHSEFLLMAFWSVCVWSFICYHLLQRGIVCHV
ncbi:heparan-alpha-glucosaminide N-acetyltransferase-like [Homalodisca vitripennis]|uniref:heparan-alpha-glucosaminide N-acetyltransferase-like n=1 Tax=Homalodisca vitripennis TaxID=197043 RepID=UPI001EEBC94B|nr:heparan-alpha-glucosaminide N-acetyltransferase-like [Homalodisca vitripennis]